MEIEICSAVGSGSSGRVFPFQAPSFRLRLVLVPRKFDLSRPNVDSALG